MGSKRSLQSSAPNSPTERCIVLDSDDETAEVATSCHGEHDRSLAVVLNSIGPKATIEEAHKLLEESSWDVTSALHLVSRGLGRSCLEVTTALRVPAKRLREGSSKQQTLSSFLRRKRVEMPA